MMGRQRWDQRRLFYEFRLENRIPENRLLQRMNVSWRWRSPICTKGSNVHAKRPGERTAAAVRSIEADL
jgi:hypothetical protein